MKKHYVYEIVNLMGTVEYVGETKNPYNRWKLHKCNSKSSGSSLFNKRCDVFMNIVKEFDNKKDAFNYQCELQKYYGIKTDREKYSEAKKGKIPWNKGLKQTEEHLNKRIQALTGKKYKK